MSLETTIIDDLSSFLVDRLKKNMDEISYGRKYKIGGRVHIASKPYDPPNVFSGDLKSTIRSVKQRNRLILGSGNQRINYAKYLELGTSQMKPRPNLLRLLNKDKHLIEKRVKNSILKHVRRNWY